MTPASLDEIRRLAKQVHDGQKDPDGSSHFAHVERVAEAVRGQDAIAATLLHDVLEDTTVAADDLRAAGVPADVMAAVELLTHATTTPYDDYIKMLAAADGRGAELARTVKAADLADNLARSRKHGDKRRIAKYEHALSLLRPHERQGSI